MPILYGKEVCKQLREVRLTIAKENGIDYTPEKCNHKGDCPGTCPVCEAELQFIAKALEEKEKKGESLNILNVAKEKIHVIEQDPDKENFLSENYERIRTDKEEKEKLKKTKSEMVKNIDSLIASFKEDIDTLMQNSNENREKIEETKKEIKTLENMRKRYE